MEEKNFRVLKKLNFSIIRHCNFLHENRFLLNLGLVANSDDIIIFLLSDF